MTTFETAKSYRIDGYDHYETPEECLLEWADSECLRTEADAKRAVSVTVHAYALADREYLDFDNMSDDMMAQLEEALADANLNLTDDIDKLKDHDAYRRCKSVIRTALADFAETMPVTKLSDKSIASRTYSADEVLAVLRRVKPSWFKEVG